MVNHLLAHLLVSEGQQTALLQFRPGLSLGFMDGHELISSSSSRKASSSSASGEVHLHPSVPCSLHDVGLKGQQHQ